MKNVILSMLILFMANFASGQAGRYSFDNEYASWNGRTDYFKWKVYLKGDKYWLASIKQVEYYLDPTYKTIKRTITQVIGGENFTLCSNGWGEFTLRIKIVFKNPNTATINETYKLDLHSSAKRSRSYKCP